MLKNHQKNDDRGAESVTLNIAAFLRRARANGPGERFVLWVQGCPIHCPGCINKSFLPIEPRHIFPVHELAELILKTSGIEGITYSGGEPFLQARPLALLSQIVQSAGLSVVCYTGYTYEYLRKQGEPWVQKLLRFIDILIDGPFIKDKAGSYLWRGSANQRILYLTRRYTPRPEAEGAEIEFVFQKDGFTTTGIFQEELYQRILNQMRVILEQKGMNI